MNQTRQNNKQLTRVRQKRIAFLVDLDCQLVLARLEERGSLVLEDLGLLNAVVFIQLPGLRFLFEMVQCHCILNGRIGRNIKLLVTLGAERIFRADNQTRRFAFAKVQQTQLDTLDGHRIRNLAHIELNAFAVVENAIAQTTSKVN